MNLWRCEPHTHAAASSPEVHSWDPSMCVIHAVSPRVRRGLRRGVTHPHSHPPTHPPTHTHTHTHTYRNTRGLPGVKVGSDKVTPCLSDTWFLSELNDNWSPLTGHTHTRTHTHTHTYANTHRCKKHPHTSTFKHQIYR